MKEASPMRLLKTLTLFACCALAIGVVAATASSRSAAVVKIEKTKLGKVVTNSKGFTLYMFRKDKAHKSACYGGCATVWPPLLTTGKPVAGAGAKAALLGTTKRTDGKLQVTYKGYPVYMFLGDRKPGDTTGEGLKEFGANWYALTPTGTVIDRD
jgi:predicted lipoprotein with Yx(FWY)xxD motif